MSDNSEAKKLYELISNHILSKIIITACEIRLDEILTDEAMSIASLAKHLQYHPKATYRFLRALQAYSIVELIGKTHVKKGSLSGYLNRLRGPHLLHTHTTLQHLSHSMTTNNECYSLAFGKSFHAHVIESPQMLRDLTNWRTYSTIEWLFPIIYSLYDFSFFKRIFEMGGDAYLIASLLQKYPDKSGFLLDKNPRLEPAALTIFQDFQVETQVKIIQKNHIKGVADQKDIYLFSRMLLNYQDDELIRLLNFHHSQIKPGSHILIIDFLLPYKEHVDYKLSTIADINILTTLNGSLRTKDEWLHIIKKSRFQIKNYFESPDNIVPHPILPLFFLEATS